MKYRVVSTSNGHIIQRRVWFKWVNLPGPFMSRLQAIDAIFYTLERRGAKLEDVIVSAVDR